MDGATGAVRVVLELWRTTDGRIDGVMTGSEAPGRTFSGLLELLAFLEDLLASAPA